MLLGAPVLGALLTMVALPWLLWAEGSGRRAVVWVAKPAASLGFLIAGASGLDSRFGVVVFVGLSLSFVGDVALIPHGRTSFLVGLGSFLLGHVAYATAFLARGVSATATAASAMVLAGPALLVWRWLRPHLPAGMRLPVAAYMAAITAMVAFAVGTVQVLGSLPLVAGALAFFLSDLAVARDRFVARSFVNRAWGLPLYYTGQWLLAWSAGER